MQRNWAMKKDDTLKLWRELASGGDPLAVMRPIPPKTSGSRYGCDGIRIDGSPAFIDAVLSCLKALIPGENNVTRLELARNVVQRREGYKAGMNADDGAEVCYIRLHERTLEGAHVSAFFDRDLHAATEKYAETIGA